MDKQKIYYLKNGDSQETNIYRYIKFPFLLEILNGEYKVFSRNIFEDKYDSGKAIPKSYLFPMTQVSSENIRNENVQKEIEQKHKKILQNIKESKDYYTSCWSKTKDDNLMWKAYTHSCGICIQTTVDKFVLAINNKDFIIYGGSIEYNDYNNIEEKLGFMFSKKKNFQSENEFRFYFLDDTSDSINKKEEDPKNIVLNVDPGVLIEKIIISPEHTHLHQYDRIKDLLETKFPFLKNKIVQSDIKI